jgi:hypothetical protein
MHYLPAPRRSTRRSRPTVLRLDSLERARRICRAKFSLVVAVFSLRRGGVGEGPAARHSLHCDVGRWEPCERPCRLCGAVSVRLCVCRCRVRGVFFRFQVRDLRAAWLRKVNRRTLHPGMPRPATSRHPAGSTCIYISYRESLDARRRRPAEPPLTHNQSILGGGAGTRRRN